MNFQMICGRWLGLLFLFPIISSETKVDAGIVVTNLQLSGSNYVLTLSVDSDIEYSVINGETADVIYLVLEDVYDTASSSIVGNGGQLSYGTSPDASLTYTTPGGTATTLDNEGGEGEEFATGFTAGAISGTDLIISFTHSAALSFQVGGTLKLSGGDYAYQLFYDSAVGGVLPEIDNQPVTSFFAKPNDFELFASQTTNSSVPEPSTAIAMGLLGVVGFAGNRRRRLQVSAA